MAVIHSLYREGGQVTVDHARCTHCGKCAAICPGLVLEMAGDRVRVRADAPFGCIACGHCMMTCPEECIEVTGRGVSPEDLAPLPASEERATCASLAALMLARRSIRHFTDEDVEQADLERIAEMAASAPMGIPPWDIGCTIVRGKERVRDLAGQVIQGYEGFLKMFRPWVFSLMRPFVGQAKYEQFRHFIRPLAQKYVESWHAGHDVLFYGAPALLIFHHSPYAEAVDAAIACTYAMLAAESLGLGSTMIGGAPPIMERNKAICQSLGIPEGNKPCLVLIVGHPAVAFRRTIRRHFTHVNTAGGAPPSHQEGT